MEVIHSPPESSAFIPLAQHQSQTPASFYNGPPVLHYHSARSKIVVPTADLEFSAPIASLANAYKSASTQSATTNGHADAPMNGTDADVAILDAEIWVTSEKLILYSSTASTGLSIPYPTISLHAIQSLPEDEGQQGLYMQLIGSLGGDAEGAEEDEDMDSVSLTIVPTPVSAPTSAPVEADPTIEEGTPTSQPSEATQLFNALSACSNLHPDPANDDEDEGGIAGSSLFQAGLISAGNTSGGLPPPMPGSGGWITAENMGEYFDEHGNWIGGSGEADDNDAEEEENEDEDTTQSSGLGPGAGTVRTRDQGAEARDEETDDTKWRRTG